MFRLAEREPESPRLEKTSHATLAADPLQSTCSLQQLFVHARDALVVADLATGCISHWNIAAERLFGFSAAEAVGRPAEMLMPPAVARLHLERLAHYRRTGDDEILTGRGPLGIPALNRDGDEIRVELSIQPLGATETVLLTFRDARCQQREEIHALESARTESALAETERKLRRCEELLRDSAHELRRPVAQARRAAARLTRLARTATEGEASPRRLVLLAQLVEARTDEVRRRLDQTVDLALMETGAFELELERVNLVPLLGRIVAATRARSNLHRVSLAAPQGLTSSCDPRRVEAVLQDVLERAARRNPRGCWIDIDLRRPLGGIARIEVRDYGRPVSERERQRLTIPTHFDRGWSVNREIVERHGGTLSVEFPRDGGVRAVVVLPTHRVRRSSQSSAAGGPA